MFLAMHEYLPYNQRSSSPPIIICPNITTNTERRTLLLLFSCHAHWLLTIYRLLSTTKTERVLFFKVIQGHWRLCCSADHVWFPFPVATTASTLYHVVLRYYCHSSMIGSLHDLARHQAVLQFEYNCRNSIKSIFLWQASYVSCAVLFEILPP